MGSVSKIKENVFIKENWSSLAKFALIVGLVSGETQAMENGANFECDSIIRNCPDIFYSLDMNLEDRENSKNIFNTKSEESDDGLLFLDRAYDSYKDEKYDDAIHFGKIAIENAGDYLSPIFFINLAKTYTKIGNHEKADRYINLALENTEEDENYQWLLDSIAKFLTKAGRLEDAQEYKEMALQELANANSREQVKNLRIAVLELAIEYNKIGRDLNS